MKFDGSTKIEIRKRFGTVSAAAREIGVEKQDLFNFLANRKDKVSRQRRRMIREFFYEYGWMRRKKSMNKKQLGRKLRRLRRLMESFEAEDHDRAVNEIEELMTKMRVEFPPRKEGSE